MPIVRLIFDTGSEEIDIDAARAYKLAVNELLVAVHDNLPQLRGHVGEQLLQDAFTVMSFAGDPYEERLREARKRWLRFQELYGTADLIPARSHPGILLDVLVDRSAAPRNSGARVVGGAAPNPERPTDRIEGLRDELARAANNKLQDAATYRSRLPREEWEHEGGYCDEIAETMAAVLEAHCIDATTAEATHGSQHVFAVARGDDGDAVVVDVPFCVYEIERGAYVFDLIPGAVIKPEHIVIDDLGIPFAEFVEEPGTLGARREDYAPLRQRLEKPTPHVIRVPRLGRGPQGTPLVPYRIVEEPDWPVPIDFMTLQEEFEANWSPAAQAMAMLVALRAVAVLIEEPWEQTYRDLERWIAGAPGTSLQRVARQMPALHEARWGDAPFWLITLYYAAVTFLLAFPEAYDVELPPEAGMPGFSAIHVAAANGIIYAHRTLAGPGGRVLRFGPWWNQVMKALAFKDAPGAHFVGHQKPVVGAGNLRHAAVVREVPVGEVAELLRESFFSPGHQGADLGDLQQREVLDRRWFETEVPIDALVPRERWAEMVEWLRDEEEQWGPFHPGDEPIVVGPEWAMVGVAVATPGYVILDGWHRVADSVRQGKRMVRAIVGVADPANGETVGARVPRSTPWGPSQDVTEIAPGITEHHTASHGGIHLSPERQRELTQRFSFRTFAGGPWYEEDEDVAAVVIAFPEFFLPEAVAQAVRTVRRRVEPGRFQDDRWIEVARYLQGPGEPVVLAALGREAETAEAWRVSVIATSGDGWQVTVRRGDQTQTFELADYPRSMIFTDDEVYRRVLGILPPEAPGPEATVGRGRSVGAPEFDPAWAPDPADRIRLPGDPKRHFDAPRLPMMPGYQWQFSEHWVPPGSPAHVRFEYHALNDAGQKNYLEVIFPGVPSEDRSLREDEQFLRSRMEDGKVFDPAAWGLPAPGFEDYRGIDWEEYDETRYHVTAADVEADVGLGELDADERIMLGLEPEEDEGVVYYFDDISFTDAAPTDTRSWEEFMAAVTDQEPEYTCRVCGEPVEVTPEGIAHHLTPDGDIDYDLDADHVAMPDPEPGTAGARRPGYEEQWATILRPRERQHDPLRRPRVPEDPDWPTPEPGWDAMRSIIGRLSPTAQIVAAATAAELVFPLIELDPSGAFEPAGDEAVPVATRAIAETWKCLQGTSRMTLEDLNQLQQAVWELEEQYGQTPAVEATFSAVWARGACSAVHLEDVLELQRHYQRQPQSQTPRPREPRPVAEFGPATTWATEAVLYAENAWRFHFPSSTDFLARWWSEVRRRLAVRDPGAAVVSGPSGYSMPVPTTRILDPAAPRVPRVDLPDHSALALLEELASLSAAGSRHAALALIQFLWPDVAPHVPPSNYFADLVQITALLRDPGSAEEQMRLEQLLRQRAAAVADFFAPHRDWINRLPRRPGVAARAIWEAVQSLYVENFVVLGSSETPTREDAEELIRERRREQLTRAYQLAAEQLYNDSGGYPTPRAARRGWNTMWRVYAGSRPFRGTLGARSTFKVGGEELECDPSNPDEIPDLDFYCQQYEKFRRANADETWSAHMAGRWIQFYEDAARDAGKPAYKGTKDKEEGLARWYGAEKGWRDLTYYLKTGKWRSCGRARMPASYAKFLEDFPKCRPDDEAKKLAKDKLKLQYAVYRKQVDLMKDRFKPGDKATDSPTDPPAEWSREKLREEVTKLKRKRAKLLKQIRKEEAEGEHANWRPEGEAA